MNSLKFQKEPEKFLSDLPLFIHGLAFFQNGDWQEAIDRFKHIDEEEGWLYCGLSFYNKAQDAKEPLPLLNDALSVFNKFGLSDNIHDYEILVT